MDDQSKQSKSDIDQKRVRRELQEVLKRDFGGSKEAFARALGMSAANLYNIVNGVGGVTVRTARAFDEYRASAKNGNTRSKEKPMTDQATTNGHHTNGTTSDDTDAANESAKAPALPYDPKAILLEEWRDREVKCSALEPVDAWEMLTEASDQGKVGTKPVLFALSESEFRQAARGYCHTLNSFRLAMLSREEQEQCDAERNSLKYLVRRRAPVGVDYVIDVPSGCVRKSPPAEKNENDNALKKLVDILKASR